MHDRLARDALSAARVEVLGITRDSLALAAALVEDGASVTVAETHSTDPALADARRSLDRAGVRFPSAFGDAAAFDVVFVDPYVGPNARDPWLERAREGGTIISSHADYVFRRASAPKLGVTGTAGKTSTTALTTHLLRAAGRTVYVARDTRPETNLWPNYELVERADELRPPGIVVAELTSNYLEFMNASPDIAVITNLWPDHVADHGSFELYVEAKRTILRHQRDGDCAVLNGDDAAVLEHFLPACRGNVVFYGARAGALVSVRDGRLVAGRADLGPAPAEPRFAGNVLAACAAALVAGVDPSDVADALPTFGGVPFRRQLVAEARGVRVYNDGMATTPVKARAGLSTFPDGSVVLIAGGRVTFPGETLHASPEARAQLEDLAAEVRRKARAVVVFGEAAPLLAELLRAVVVADDLDGATASAARLARTGDVILFAPVFYVPLDDRARFDELVVAALG